MYHKKNTHNDWHNMLVPIIVSALTTIIFRVLLG